MLRAECAVESDEGSARLSLNARALLTSEAPAQPDSGPVAETARITHLDMLRGVAVLGILLMNAVSYGLPPAAYFNLSADGTETWLDWAIGVLGEIFIDQKFMGIFSILFGAGIVLFADRAAAKGKSAGWLSFWRNLLLLGIGVLHMLLWDGDVLVIYAVAAPILILARNAPPKALLAVGAALVLIIPIVAGAAQTGVDADGRQLGELWLSEGDASDGIGLYVIFDFFARAVGMMLIGVALFRMGVLSGQKPPQFYRRMALYGLGVGLPLAALGVAIAVNLRLRSEGRPAGRHSQHGRHDSGRAGHHRAGDPLEHAPPAAHPPRAAGDRPNGADQLSDADDHRRDRAALAAWRRRSDPHRDPGLRAGSLGAAAALVPGLAEVLPLRPLRVALARGDIPANAAAAALGPFTPPHLPPHPRKQIRHARGERGYDGRGAGAGVGLCAYCGEIPAASAGMTDGGAGAGVGLCAHCGEIPAASAGMTDGARV